MGWERAGWNTKYWDNMDQMYWVPHYSSLKSIPKKEWHVSEDRVSVPRDKVNMNAQLYTRVRKDREHFAWLRTQEEPLNHMFDIAFAIAPDSTIQGLFAEPLGVGGVRQVWSLGREVRERYGWGWHANVTQQDGFFVWDEGAIAVELKLGSKSSPDQILKYAALLVWEERASGPKEDLGLLFIVPERKLQAHWKACGLDEAAIDATYFDKHADRVKNQQVQALFLEDPEALRSVLDRLKINAISWEAHLAACRDILSAQDRSNAGEQCLARLLDGWSSAISDHLEAL